ncbi:alpha-E domain-containing protein [Altericroceibacterium xinjiangense]|uniref:alpha-E domain-containing protein n=1 Tax=Altericroceibacterium xinjiangense TaxID=762261 RepID=UPI000F7E5CD5|nr:alpha-E domain-containing protein [Altericroceibacterium xinjiangense]
MLARVAHGIFWIYRYLERAENTARLLEAGNRMALTRGITAADEEWRSVLTTLGQLKAYDEAHRGYDGPQVCDFVLRSRDNSESVLTMIERARNNARACRSAITAEVWEAINEGWMTLRDLLAKPVRASSLGTALAAVRRQSSLVRGSTYGSMLRNEIYCFSRIGTLLERADNSARILDVKYYVLLPSPAHVGMPLDTAQWDHVLRSLSGDRAYRWLNAGRMDARSIAEFLILDDRFPRSLSFCYAAMRSNLARLARIHGEEGAAHACLRDADLKLARWTIDEVFDRGLHEFLIDFIVSNQRLAHTIAEEYRFLD